MLASRRSPTAVTASTGDSVATGPSGSAALLLDGRQLRAGQATEDAGVIAELNDAAVGERRRLPHAAPVHERPVRAREILDRPALAIRRDAQVRPRERAVGM